MNNKNLSGVAPQNAKIRKKVDATRKKRFPEGDKPKSVIRPTSVINPNDRFGTKRKEPSFAGRFLFIFRLFGTDYSATSVAISAPSSTTASTALSTIGSSTISSTAGVSIVSVSAGVLLQAAKANMPATAIRNITFFISLKFLKLSLLLFKIVFFFC